MTDELEREVRRMTDDELQRLYESIRGNPKRNHSRRLGNAESVALAAVMAERARRVKVAP